MMTNKIVATTQTYITRTFSDVYPNKDVFKNDLLEWTDSDMLGTMNDNDIKQLWVLITSKYGDSHIRYTNEHLFTLRLMKQIEDYYPRVMVIKNDQKRLRNATVDELKKIGKAIMNQGANNTADFTTEALDGSVQLSGQAVSENIGGELAILRERQASLKATEEDKFLDGLKPLFIYILQPQRDLLYVTEEEN